MEVLLAAIVLAFALAGLAYPILVGGPRARRDAGHALGELTAQRDGIYAMLRDLDQDFQIGKLDEPDYNARREKYLARAAAVLRRIDAESASAPPTVEDDAIEQEVAALRRARQEPESVPGGFCRHCGQPHRAGDLFCAKCGQALS